MTEIFDDIKKLYRFKKPCFELQNFIEFFSETSLEATSQYIDGNLFTVKLFPSFTPTIWLNLGSKYQLNFGNKTINVDEKKDVLILRSNIVERVNLPTDNIFTIKFHPIGFEVFFGISQSKIGNEIIDVNEILPAFFINKIKKLGNFVDRVALLEIFFLEKLEKSQQKKHIFSIVKLATEQFIESGLVLKNNELLEKSCVSEKTFYRYFQEAVGTNPKNYFSIIRTRTALSAYKNAYYGFSPYNFGYYDFGHFSKDVVRFTGNNLTFFQK
jgi:hypothetical protein